jgi:NADH:ubiquinone oxidoreductase subunit 4 (subunit M)
MNRILFGPIKYNAGFFPEDITSREFILLTLLLIFVVCFGVFPEMFFSNVELTVAMIFEHFYL